MNKFKNLILLTNRLKTEDIKRKTVERGVAV